MKTISNLLSIALLGAILSACGGGGGTTPIAATLVTTSNVTAAVNPTTAAAVANQPVSFPSGVPSFGTTGATTVAFTSTAASPTFNISSAQGTATGVTTFGSCIFTVTVSSFPAGSPLAVGQVVTINPCVLNVGTSGGAADGTSSSRSVSLVLGTLVSTAISLPVVINASGTVTINNVPVGTVTVAPVTGS